MLGPPIPTDRTSSLELVRITEAAAISAAHWMGHGDNDRADEAAVEAMRKVPNIIMPFPGGVVRSGSKVGSKYPALGASTNDAFCPSLRELAAKTELDADIGSVMEIVIDGLTDADVSEAMRVGLRAATDLGAGSGLKRISAGNYGGKLGPFHYHLRKLVPGAAA